MGYTYCMSDIHGEIDRYNKMLQLIEFSEEDTLYIIGDVIDRAPGGIDIIRDIMARDNVHLLMGNHEMMCLATLGPMNEIGARQLWKDNGGSCTLRELLYHMTVQERHLILNYLAALPISEDISVNGQRYHLVHGFPTESVYDQLWERPNLDTPNPFQDGRLPIIGHTPVIFLLAPGKEQRTAYLKKLEEENDYMRILHTDGFIDIDCGCGNSTTARRLACIRLDDMKEYYT